MTNAVDNKVDDFTVGKDQWLKMIENARQTIEFMPGAYYDLDGVNFLAPIIESYMNAPVTIYKGKPIEARSVTFKDIKETLDTFMNNGERIVMYMLIYIPSRPVYAKLDEATYTNIPLETPYVTEGSWKMRFGKI